jgi:integrase
LGRLRLKALTPAHVRALYRQRLDSGLAPRTVLHVHHVLSKALKQAHDDGLVPRNAAGPVKPPRPRGEEIRPLNPEQVRALFGAAGEAGDRLRALYVLAVTAGLRRGELLGLRWEDVDLESGMLQVRRTLSEPKGGYVFEAPKSGKGRQVRLTRKALVALKEHRRRQFTERMQTAAFWRDHGLVFPSTVGTPLSGGNLTRAFKAALKRAGLPEGTRFHDLRHTCATLLLRQGVNPKYVQELLGHADISLTLNVYSHVLPDMGDAAAGAMDAVLEYA